MRAKSYLRWAVSLFIFIAIAFAVSRFSFSDRQVQRQLTLAPQITSASPNPAKLQIGGTEVSVAIKGNYLNLINSVKILQGDRIVPSTEIVITLVGTPTSTAATITLKATAQAIAGTDYRLRALYGTRAVDISTSVLSIEVYQLTALPMPKPPTTQPPQPPIIMVNATTLSSSRFNNIVARIFNSAYFYINSGWVGNRQTTFSVPKKNLLIQESLMERVDYVYSEQEIGQCDCQRPGTPPRPRSALRIYIENQTTGIWIGSIAQGKFSINLPFSDKLFVKTRARETKTFMAGGVENTCEWSEECSDAVIPDYCCEGLGINITMIPVVAGGNLSLDNIQTSWNSIPNYHFCSETFTNPITKKWALNLLTYECGYFCLENMEKSLIMNYRDLINQIIAARINNYFSSEAICSYITEELNKEIKSGNFAGLNIVSISGMGSDLTITFDKYVPKY